MARNLVRAPITMRVVVTVMKDPGGITREEARVARIAQPRVLITTRMAPKKSKHGEMGGRSDRFLSGQLTRSARSCP